MRARKPAARPTARSRAAFARARRLLPGGVNSPVRAFRAVGGTPYFVARARGPFVWDLDGNRCLDYVCSWGALLLGHAAPEVVRAVKRAATRGTSYGAPTAAETELAAAVRAAFPSVELLRLTSSGTEAALHALRLARGYTGREKIVKFAGCYHGASDSLLVKAGSGALTFGVPDSAGVPRALAALTLVAPYNDLAAVRRLFARHGRGIAAVIVEPVAGNCGVIPPAPGFLAGLRALTRKAGALLIFDEVITGFRVARGGAQERYGLRPDLTLLGKILGGGLPLAAFGGRREIMERLAPLGDVYQAGTLSGNPLAVAAGLSTLRALSRRGVYARLERLGARLERGLTAAARAAGIPVRVNRVGSMLTLFFAAQPVTDLATALRSDAGRYRAFFHGMLARGIAFAPSPYEAAFVSLAHTERQIDRTVAAAAAVFQGLAAAPLLRRRAGERRA